MGLPAKFDSWRDGQEEFIDVIVTSQKRVPAACAPTGFGKSAAVVGAALRSGKNTAIVTLSNGLLDQYMNDFESIGMASLKGRRQYKCDMRPDDPNYSCEEGYAARCPYKGTIACACSKAEMTAAVSPLVVTNYAKWTSQKMFGQGLSHIEQVVFDEGHYMPDAIASAMQVQLNYKEVNDGLKIDFPDYNQSGDFATWKTWACSARVVAENAMIAAQARITGVSDPKPTWVKHFTHMRNLLRRINTLATARAADWVADEYLDQGFVFDPIRAGRYGEAALLLRLKKVIPVSATLRPKTLFMSGIGSPDIDFREYDSDFDPARCPIYYVPTMRVDSNAQSLDPLWLRLDQFASPRRDRKGAVHTISYDRQQMVLANSRYASSMIHNKKGDKIDHAILEFEESGPGSIIVSPSVGVGYDFADDMCRWSFICKIPFEPPSKIVKAREEDDKEYRGYRAMSTFVQMIGRDVRSKTDWSERLIGDDHCRWFMPRFAQFAPKQFRLDKPGGFFRTVDILPPPLRL
jgi:Rad3-related DNA helicase